MLCVRVARYELPQFSLARLQHSDSFFRVHLVPPFLLLCTRSLPP